MAALEGAIAASAEKPEAKRKSKLAAGGPSFGRGRFQALLAKPGSHSDETGDGVHCLFICCAQSNALANSIMKQARKTETVDQRHGNGNCRDGTVAVDSGLQERKSLL